MIDQYVRQYGKRLFGLCMYLCKNPHDAEDLYQDTWAKVLQYLPSYDTTKEFEPWLTQICVNTYRHDLKKRIRIPFLDFSSNIEKDRFLNTIPTHAKEDYSSLHHAIHKLSEKLRVVVVLYYFQGKDISSVASILKIPEGTVKSRLNKARSVLKEVLVDET